MAKTKKRNSNRKPSAALSSKAPSAETPAEDFDINAFVQEQKLEMDEDVAKLFATDAPAAKRPKTKAKLTPAQKKKNRAALASNNEDGSGDEDDAMVLDGEVVMNDSEDEREMMAYVESLKDQMPVEAMQEKVYANHKVCFVA